MDLNPHDQARMMVVDYVMDKQDEYKLEFQVVYGDTCVIEFSLTGKSWQAYVIVNDIKDALFSVRYDATEGRTYFDAYTKTDSKNFNQRTYNVVGMTGEAPQPA